MERRNANSEKGLEMKWRVVIKVSYYEVDWIFDSAEEAAEFAIKAACGKDEHGKPVSVMLIGVLPEEGEQDE